MESTNTAKSVNIQIFTKMNKSSLSSSNCCWRASILYIGLNIVRMFSAIFCRHFFLSEIVNTQSFTSDVSKSMYCFHVFSSFVTVEFHQLVNQVPQPAAVEQFVLVYCSRNSLVKRGG